MRLRLLSALALIVPLVWSSAASALQWTPVGTERLHTLASGQPGAQWTTGGLGSGGQLSYDAGTGIATLTAGLDVLNYFDPNVGSCPTDPGSNCSFNFGPDLAVSIEAEYAGGVVTDLGGGFLAVQLNFQTTANALPDLVVSDPTDIGFGNVLEGNWQAGFFNDNPTTGLSFSAVFNTATNSVLGGSVSAGGFLSIDSATAYANLFESGTNYFGLQFATLSDFGGVTGGLDGLFAYAAANNGELPSFTAEAIGQVYRVTSGEFVVPEPATLVLLAGGLTVLGARRRSA